MLLESTLTRLLAVAQFYHFAFLVVSLALLGFGASGSLLALAPRWLASNQGADGEGGSVLDRVLAFCGIAFALSVGLAYGVVNFLPFDSYSIAWDRRQVLLFGLYYLVLTLPFLFAGLGIGFALAISKGRSHLVYAANLLGSGVGALIAPMFLSLAGVAGAVLASGLVGFSAASGRVGERITLWRWGRRILVIAGLAGFGTLTALNLSGMSPLGMTISSYKGLAQAMRYPGAERIFSRWNAISRVEVISRAGTRLMPGMSYTFAGVLPEQFGLSLDAESLQPITLVEPIDFKATDFMPEAVTFSLRPQARVLVLEPGGGLAVLQTLAGGAKEITVVVSNPLVPDALQITAGQYNVYTLPGVNTSIETPRVFLEQVKEKYDIVYLPLTDTYRPVTSGAYSLSESYTLTVEAFEKMVAHLNPSGLLVTTRWLQTPPSESIRLIATLSTSLEKEGFSHPEDVIVAFRGIQTMTVLVQPEGWSAEELELIRSFAEKHRYDLVWAPNIRPEETNRFNRLPESSYYEIVQTLFNTLDPRAFYTAYPFAIAPPTDDRPFFFHFFKWGQTPELLATLGHTWQPFGGSGYFVLLALLVLVIILSGLLILAPLLARQEAISSNPIKYGVRGRVMVYFSLLGLAFIFVEIPLIQRWILVLGHPTYAFSVIVLALLTFSSLGSSLARARWLPRRGAFAALVVFAVITPWVVTQITEVILTWPFIFRALAISITLFPLAGLMGLPFPTGLAWLEEQSPGLVPWAWAVNGCASVVGAVMAAILALSYGFTLVLLLGAGAYAGAFLTLYGRALGRSY